MLQNKQSTANPLVCLEPREVHNITGLLQIKNFTKEILNCGCCMQW